LLIENQNCNAVRFSINNQQSSIINASLIRNHPQNFGEISIAHQTGLSELPLGLGFFRRQDVTQFRVSPLHLSRRRLLEALGSDLVRF